MQLSIIVVSYNTASLTEQTVRSIEASLALSPDLRKSSEILVVDNNSTDESIARLKVLQKEFPHFIHLIENTENVGFARANNQAIEKSSGEFILLLNSDTIVQGDAIPQMVKAFQQHPVQEQTAALQSAGGALDKLGILAAQLQNTDGSPQPQGGSFPTLFSLFCHMSLLDDVPFLGQFLPSTQHTGRRQSLATETSMTGVQQQDWVGGTAMMVRRVLITEIGSLDEKIFMYGEDVEWCMRAKNHHWDVAILPSAKITHLGSASSSSKKAILGELKAYQYIWAKHKPLWQQQFANMILKLGIELRIFLFATIGLQPAKAEAYIEARALFKE